MNRMYLLLLLLLPSAAASADAAENKAAPVSYESEIRPLFQARCTRCHGEKTQKAGLSLLTPETIRKGSESGPIIVPGKSAESKLFEMVHEGRMPPGKKDPLSKDEIALLRRWIDAGAPFGNTTVASRPEVTQHDVVPLLLLRCTACHGRQKQEGGLDLRTRAAMLKGGKSGPALVPGKPEQSLMLKRIHAEEMPPRKRLIEAAVKPMEPDEVRKLTRWIELGAPEVPADPDLAGTPHDPLVRPADREFWAFRPPQPVAVPNVTNADRVRNPVDAFILQRLEAKGLTLSPETDLSTLVRRVTLDLTGLPPTPEELDAALGDKSPDWYEKVVERLLASPRYGERWGRHWLDIAGYADCEGKREQHLPRPFAWRYRDYVIRSLNADRPYDRFLLEQLAGDELADYRHAPEITREIEDNLVATAFLRLAPDPTWANLTGFVPDRLEVMADSFDVLGSGVMGLTLKCARCHSHKFDPIPQRDYYRLVAVFKGAYDEHDWLKPELKSFGGAYSAGFGERHLPFVTTAERQHSQGKPEPRIMALWDRGDPSPTYIYRRGDYLTPGQPVNPGPPAVLGDGKTSFTVQPPWPGAESTGRRLAFARWLTQPEQPLTARVMVNRIWKHHFGQGIVRTLGNFGKTGDRPSHPELLDWLAREYVRNGWSTKTLQRMMVTSSVYRQSSIVTPAAEKRDADNRLLSRMPLRRMEAEVLRDSMLFIAGRLDESRYGPPDPVKVRPDGQVLSGSRRSIYVEQLRKHPPTVLETFDLPAMNPNCLQRPESVVAPQALHLMNDATVREMAEQLAGRIIREAGDNAERQIERVFRVAIGRPPNAEEREISSRALTRMTEEWKKQDAQTAARKALTTYCHTLMNSAAFLYID